MTTLNSPPLSASCTFTAGPPRQITFHFTRPFVAALFLGQMTLTEKTINGIIGHISPGTGPTHGGTANLEVNTALFSTIFAAASANPAAVTVVIQYEDGTFTVDNITCMAQLAAKTG